MTVKDNETPAGESEKPAEVKADVGEVDLDAALDALDLDMNCFEDSVAFNEEPKDEEQEPDVPVFEEAVVFPPAHTKPPEEVTGINWKDRPEIYSRHFKPSPKEREELEEIAKLLEVKSGLPGSGGGGIIGNILGGSSHGESNDDPQNPQIQWNNLVSGKATNQTHNLPISIILQQGLVMYKDYDEKNQQPVAHHGCELLLLTRGFLLASRDIKYNFFGKKQDILTPLGSSLWTDVRQIETTDQQSILLKCGSTDTKDQVSLEIMPSSDLSGWRSAFQAAAIKAHLHFLPDAHDELGWQHRLCHSPWFTEAVTGEWQVDQEQGQEMTTSSSAEQGLDSLDEYNSYAPLHYATRANHTDIMRGLLEAGASPNVQDGGGKTPMYYAQRDELPFATIQLLEEFGAEKEEEAMRGELFGKVADTEKARALKREEEESKAKAAQEKIQSAQSKMSKNMAAMQQRGEQIEELGNKATELNDGAQDYGDMAKQLKEKMKKKSVWGF